MDDLIRLNFDSKSLSAALDAVARRQIPFAASRAVTALANRAVNDLRWHMGEVFDRPTAWTMNAFSIKPATKANPTAVIFARDFAGKGTPAWKYLKPEGFGGPRRLKRFERALGFLDGAPRFTVPGRGAKLNQYGNIGQGEIEKLLSALGAAETTAGYSANRTARSSRLRGRRQSKYFVAHSKRDGSLLGIYRVVSSGRVEPVLVFAKSAPSYHPRFFFREVVANSIEMHAARFFADALRRAIATAR